MNITHALKSDAEVDLQEWGRQAAQYSRARRGRNERGAGLAECSLVQGMIEAIAVRRGRRQIDPSTAVPQAATAA